MSKYLQPCCALAQGLRGCLGWDGQGDSEQSTVR